MHYLAIMDDKTLQYPFGTARMGAGSFDRVLFHHLLFRGAADQPAVLEGGFIIASADAEAGEADGSLVLDAVRAGLVKVAARIQDLGDYVADRDRKGHRTPKRVGGDNLFLAAMQAACDEQGAWIDYPLPDSLDSLTFDVLWSLAESSDRLIPVFGSGNRDRRVFLDALEHARNGVGGRPRTARTAWEHAASACWASTPDSWRLHALMTIANRERQIIRGAAFATAAQTELTIETGFSDAPHNLLSNIVTTADPSSSSYRTPLHYPRVPYELAMRRRVRLLVALADSQSMLSTLREQFSTCLDLHLADPGSDAKRQKLQTASGYYEKEIYRVAGEQPSEAWLATDLGVALLAGAVVGTAVGEPAQLIAARFDTLSRRGFLKWAFGSAVTVGTMSTENVLAQHGKDLVRDARSAVQPETSDHVRRSRNLHARYQVDRQASAQWFVDHGL